MTDAQLLELALFYSVPRRDVRPLAESLLARFGSLSGVLDASAAELCEIAGVGEHSALFLGLLGNLRDLARLPELRGAQLTEGGLRGFLKSRLRGVEREALLAVYLDREGLVAAVKGLAAASLADPEALLRVTANQARLLDAVAVVLARGVPGTGPLSDRELTLALTLWRGLDKVGVALRDYVIVTPEEYLSSAALLPSARLSFRPLAGRGWGAEP